MGTCEGACFLLLAGAGAEMLRSCCLSNVPRLQNGDAKLFLLISQHSARAGLIMAMLQAGP